MTEFESLFNTCFENYFDGLFYYAYTYLRDEEKSKDVVQSVFTKWWEIRKTPGDLTACKAYLYVAIYRRCLNSIRDDRLVKKNTNVYMNHLVSTERSSHDSMCHEELKDKIQAAIESLPAKRRAIFTKSRYEEKTYSEIAGEMNLSVKTVEVHISRALKTLRRRLHSYLE